MPHAQTERAHACDALLTVGPDAPTLCEGWTAHDLAAHLWLRENELRNALGFTVERFEPRTNDRMVQLKSQLQFTELVDLIRHGPPTISLFGIPGVDEALNGVEYLIHGMDVRRANDLPEPDRDPAFDDWAWSRVQRLASVTLRNLPVSLVLERAGHRDDTVRASSGDRIVTVIGSPTELLLYAFGRREAADVRVIGLDSAVKELVA